MGLFGRNEGQGNTADVFKLWGQPGWHRVDVVGESHHANEIRALFPASKRLDSTELFLPVTLVHESNNKYDPNAVAVTAGTGLLGYLSRDDAKRYAPVLAALQTTDRQGTTTARIWGYDQENWETGRIEFVGSVSLDLAEPHMLIPTNAAPTVGHSLLPVGSAIQVTGEENYMNALSTYLNANGECWVHATLHQVVEQGARTSKTLAEVRIDDSVVGRLTPKMSSDLLPAVNYLADRGQLTCVRAIVKGNALKAEVVLYTARASELTTDWFESHAGTDPTTGATPGSITSAELPSEPKPAEAATAIADPNVQTVSTVVQTPALPPADWYPDPHGIARLRYWSGVEWTEHTAP